MRLEEVPDLKEPVDRRQRNALGVFVEPVVHRLPLDAKSFSNLTEPIKPLLSDIT